MQAATGDPSSLPGPVGAPAASANGDGSDLRHWLEVVPAGAYLCDPEGLITYCNQRAVALWGRAPHLNDPRDRYCGSFKLFSADGQPIAHNECWMALALRELRDFDGEEIVIERPDGSRVTALAHAHPIRDASGRLTGALNVLVDISERKRAEEAQSLLAAIVASSQDAIICKTLEGRILSWNAGAERLFGYTAEEAIGQPITLLIPPERQGEERLILERLRRGERVEHFETVRVSKAGRRLDISLTISPVRDGSGRIVAASKVARDITARKQAEEALRESEGQFRQLADALPQIVWTARPDGYIDYYNDRWYEYTGFPRDTYGDTSWQPILHPDDLGRCVEKYSGCIRSGEPYEIEYRFKDRTTGGYRWFLGRAYPVRDHAGRIVRWFGTCTDIDDMKRVAGAHAMLKDELAAQLADLRRVQAMSVRLSTTLELQPILDETLRTAVAIAGTQFGLLLLFDPEREQLRIGASLGFSQQSLESLDGVPLGGGASGASYLERRRVVVEDVEIDPLFAPYRDVARAAGFRAVHSTPLLTRSGKVVGVLSTHHPRPHRPSDRETHLLDLCARQAVDFIENARLYEELRAADRRKDEFLATLAHELRNPLAPLRNSLQILRMSEELGPAVERVRDIMERQVDHMVRLVDDLLEVSRITRGKVELRKEPTDLATVVRNGIETSRPLIEAAGHQLAIAISPEPIMLQADPVRLAQVIANLLNNAAKYTENGGQIWISARRHGDEAVVTVRDTGMGIPPEMLPRVFEMFAQVNRTLNRAQGGLGIGLTLVRNLVELHRGRIEAHSDGPGQGSEFIVHLPLAVEVTPEESPARSNGFAAKPAPPRRILVVDDLRDAGQTLGKLLQSLGHRVSVAQHAAAAIASARLDRPDVVISDIGMPEIDGYELARRIRQEPECKHVVLVALTGYGQDSDRQRAKDAGFDYHLIKPVDLQSLQELLASLPPPREPAALKAAAGLESA